MQDKERQNWDSADEPVDETEESAAGDLKPMSRLGVIGARASLLLGLAATAVIGVLDPWPTVTRN